MQTVVQMRAIRVRPVAGALGAEVSGVDLAEALSDAAFRDIQDALLKFQVLFFREQDISPEQQRAFAAKFGPLDTHPAYPTVEGLPEVMVLESTRDAPTKIEAWHTDMTFRARPPLGTMLHALIVPDAGGDTEWASMTEAYDGLSPRMQRHLAGLEAEHSFAHGFQESLAEPGGRERLADAVAANPPVRHPVIRTHPATGAKLLFVNPLFTTRILGLPPRESRALLTFLYDHATQPEYTCRFRWEPRSLALWDNRATQHRPINDYFPAHRKMHRVVILGDAPV